jgi:hypothetical protein
VAAVTAAVPTLSQIQSWSTEHLETAASHWTETAETWEHAFTTIHREAPTPGGTSWLGVAADAAVLRTGTDRVVIVGAADSLHAAAKAARYGAGEIAGARQLALQAVNDARAAGFTVGEDLSVTTGANGPAALMAARQAQAQALAAAIRTSAENLAAVDAEVAGKVSAAITGLSTAQFGSNPVTPTTKKPQVQAVNYGPKPQSPTPNPGAPDDPAPTNLGGPSGGDIGRVLDKLPRGSQPVIREVRTPQDLKNLWDWMKQNGIDNPARYGDPGKGVWVDLPDGTGVGQRFKAGSTGIPALDVNIPGEGYIKVHINPDTGGVPEIPARPAVPAVPVRGPAVELPPPLKPAPVEAPPLEGAPRVGGLPIAGGPGTPIGPTLVPPPHSIHHLPIVGRDDLDAPWEYEE